MVKSCEVGLRQFKDRLRLHRKPTDLKTVLNHLLRWFIESDLSRFQIDLGAFTSTSIKPLSSSKRFLTGLKRPV